MRQPYRYKRAGCCSSLSPAPCPLCPVPWPLAPAPCALPPSSPYLGCPHAQCLLTPLPSGLTCCRDAPASSLFFLFFLREKGTGLYSLADCTAMAHGIGLVSAVMVGTGVWGRPKARAPHAPSGCSTALPFPPVGSVTLPLCGKPLPHFAQPSLRPLALPTILAQSPAYRLRHCRHTELSCRPACRCMRWELEHKADRDYSRSICLLTVPPLLLPPPRVTATSFPLLPPPSRMGWMPKVRRGPSGSGQQGG